MLGYREAFWKSEVCDSARDIADLCVGRGAEVSAGSQRRLVPDAVGSWSREPLGNRVGTMLLRFFALAIFVRPMQLAVLSCEQHSTGGPSSIGPPEPLCAVDGISWEQMRYHLEYLNPRSSARSTHRS